MPFLCLNFYKKDKINCYYLFSTFNDIIFPRFQINHVTCLIFKSFKFKIARITSAEFKTCIGGLKLQLGLGLHNGEKGLGGECNPVLQRPALICLILAETQSLCFPRPVLADDISMLLFTQAGNMTSAHARISL